ncbi:MAG: hypothetical protein WDN48_01660 [Pseudolabrys sp.]
MLTYSPLLLDFFRRFPLEAWQLDCGLTRTLPKSATLIVEDEGFLRQMSTRQTICAIGPAAARPAPVASLILGTLLLLIGP